jgi:hypothetical protein
MNSINISADSFSTSYTFPSNKTTYYARVTAYASDPLPYVSFIPLNPLAIGISAAESYFILLAFMLSAFVLAWYEHIAFIIMLDAIIIIVQLLGVFAFTIGDIGFAMVSSIILILFSVWKGRKGV